jgi:NAD(P)-dependent dehydrogenase (short-subunit alcohol dehydrogenase family)
MDLQLQGKRALVTGSSAGIGRAIALRLAHEGATVVVHGRDQARAEKIRKEIVSAGGKAEVALGELTKEADAREIARQVVGSSEGVDILVNNAGSYVNKAWFETTAASWRDVYEHDVISVVRLVKLLVPAMRKRGWGRVINIATGMATTPQAVMPDYAAAKAALVNSTLSLMKAVAGAGITVNTVSPGVILTDNVENLVRKAAKARDWGDDWATIQRNWFEQVLGDRYVSRFGTCEEVADVVAFVASPLASYLNGAIIRVDGGKSPSIN